MAQDGVGTFQGTELVQTLNHALSVGLQTVFLVGQVFGHMHMQPGAVFSRKRNGFFKQVVVDRERGMQPHVALAA